MNSTNGSSDLDLYSDLASRNGLPSKTSVGPGCVDDDAEWGKFHHYMLTIAASFLITVGTIGNVISFCVLQQKAYKKNVISGALSYLAVLDTLILWTTVLKLLFEGILHMDRDDEPVLLCIIGIFWSELISAFDNWLLVFITLTRVIHIKFPFKSQTYCSKFNYYGMMTLLHVFVACSFSSGVYKFAKYLLFTKHIDLCFKILTKTVTKIERIFYVSVNFVLPAITLVVLNKIMSTEINTIKQRQDRLHAQTPPTPTATTPTATTPPATTPLESRAPTPTLSQAPPAKLSVMLRQSMGVVGQPAGVLRQSNTAAAMMGLNQSLNETGREGVHVSLGSIGTMRSTQLSETLDPVRKKYSSWQEPVNLECSASSMENVPARLKFKVQGAAVETTKTPDKGKPERDTRLNSLTRILYIANCLFIVLNLPWWIFHLFFQERLVKDTTLGCHFREAIVDIFLLIRWSGHSLNFYFYCATGSRFREELYALFRFRRRYYY